MKVVGDYIHSLGLKFGVYSDAGSKTCAGRPGGLGHEYQDAIQYAAWGVDYLKYDWCSTTTQDAKASYAIFALRSTQPDGPSCSAFANGAPLSHGYGEKKSAEICGAPPAIFKTAGRTANGRCSCCSNGMLAIVDQQVGLQSYAGPGHWNDPDMLEVGNGGMTDIEYRSHFSLWAILAAPLIAGNDLRNMRPEIHDILTNKEVIAVDQDSAGHEGERVAENGDLEVWAKQMRDGSRAVVLLNRGSSEQEIKVNWEELGYPGHFNASVRDLWQHKDLGKFTEKFSAPVASHGVVMVTVRP